MRFRSLEVGTSIPTNSANEPKWSGGFLASLADGGHVQTVTDDAGDVFERHASSALARGPRRSRRPLL